MHNRWWFAPCALGSVNLCRDYLNVHIRLLPLLAVSVLPVLGMLPVLGVLGQCVLAGSCRVGLIRAVSGLGGPCRVAISV